MADDHAIVAEGVRMIVEDQPDMIVVGCLQSSQEAVRRTKEIKPDIVLIDHAMPILNGTEATQMICSACPRTRVIILSMHSNQVHVLRALHAGASGYIVKRSAAVEVVDAIRSVHQGKRYLSPELVDKVLGHLAQSPSIGDPVARLSLRERQVLQMLAEGHSVATIAITISLSPRTVETYRARMMEKLDIHDVPSLVRFAIQRGLASLD